MMIIKEVTPPRERLFVLEVSDKELKLLKEALVAASYNPSFNWNEGYKKIFDSIAHHTYSYKCVSK
jgi:hypothetical protein